MAVEAKRASAWVHGAACIGLTAAVLLAFHRVVTFDFVGYDDPEVVTNNPHVVQGFTLNSVAWAATSVGYFANWFPVTWYSHMLDVKLFGLHAGGHHATNLALHVVNALLLYWLLYRMTSRAGASAMVAALFAVHPFHVETVAWVSERKGVLSTTFWLLTILAYVRYAASPNARRYVAVLALFAAGLMTKPMLVTLPCVLLLLDYWPLARYRFAETGWARRAARIVLEKAPLFALAAAISIATVVAQERSGGLKSAEQFPLATRLANAPIAYVTYLAKTIVPYGLAVIYPQSYAPPERWKAIGAAAILLIVTVAAVFLARRRPYVFVGWCWFVGALIPVSQLVQVGSHAMADRYTYVPHIGLFIVMVWLAADLARGRSVPVWATVAGSSVVIAIFCALSVRQSEYWRDSVSLYTRALDVTTGNRIAHNNLGRSLMDLGRVDEAIAHYEEALRIAPDYETARMNYGNALVSTGRWDEARAQFEKAAEIDPSSAPARTNLGNVYMQIGQLEKAIEQYKKGIELEPNETETYNGLGACYFQMGKYGDAATQFEKVLAINPGHEKARRNLAAARAKLETGGATSSP
ncbi:MAG: tetratricopeptide repeat protein [Candidatus Hydrogenedentota bacterium]